MVSLQIVFSLLLAYAMAVPAPEANPEATPEAEADPAVLYSISYAKPATYAYAPYYYGYGYGLGYYGHGLGYYGHYLGKRSAEPQPQPEFQPRMSMPSPHMRKRYV